MNTQNVTAQKTEFANQATAYGVQAGYQGKNKKMVVSGDPAKVKSFIRVQCLKGKNHWPFKFGQATEN